MFNWYISVRASDCLFTSVTTARYKYFLQINKSVSRTGNVQPLATAACGSDRSALAARAPPLYEGRERVP